MDWSQRVYEIQEKYFSTQTGTHLCIACDSSTGIVSWGFTMLDYGMCHTIGGHSRVQFLNSRAIFVVNGQEVGAKESDALESDFGGQYALLKQEILLDLSPPSEP